MTCNCAKSEDIVNCGDNEEEFVEQKGLRLLRTKPDAGLYVCPACNSYWHVDHLQRGPQAIKGAEPFRWDTFDDLPFRLKFMERFHGGVGSQRCMHAGCNDFALKDLALCVRHAYPELGKKS